jgi:hypothetical protein
MSPHPRCTICRGQGRYTTKNELGERTRLKCDCKAAWAETEEALKQVCEEQKANADAAEALRLEHSLKKKDVSLTVRKAPHQHPNVVAQKCSHHSMHFEAGGLYLVCSNKGCGQAWQAVNKDRLVPDYMARGWGLSELDVRKNPLS